MQTFRADYIDWCLPLFDTGSPDKNNYTCTFLATQGSMYFVNHTALSWDDYQCCLFEEVGLESCYLIIGNLFLYHVWLARGWQQFLLTG